MSHQYCTICSTEYMYQFIVLYKSLIKHDKDFTIYVLCLSEEVKKVIDLLYLENCKATLIDVIEDINKELNTLKKQRSTSEYAWTLKAPFITYLFEKEDLEHVIYLDSDIAFFADTDLIFEEFSKYSVMLTDQYYTGSYAKIAEMYGNYQAGFICFRNDANARDCLDWWQEKCFEWCYSVMEKDRWADQKYLNKFLTEFSGVGVSENIGINLAPFTLYKIYDEDKVSVIKEEDSIYINDTKIIAFHFYGFKYHNSSFIDLCNYWMKFNQNTIKYVYDSYILECQNSIEEINRFKINVDSIDLRDKYVSNYYFNEDKNVNNAFCTIIDKKNLIKALALIESINKYRMKYKIWICCLDDYSYNILRQLDMNNVYLISINNIQGSDLYEVREQRTYLQYKKVLKVYLLYYILKNNFYINKLAYIDDDMYLYLKPNYLFDNWKSGYLFAYYSNLYTEKVEPIYECNILGVKRSNKIINWLDNSLYYWMEESKKNKQNSSQVDKRCLTVWDNKNNWINKMSGLLALNIDEKLKLRLEIPIAFKILDYDVCSNEVNTDCIQVYDNSIISKYLSVYLDSINNQIEKIVSIVAK